MTQSIDEGWAVPLLSKKAHYFRDARSLCKSWLYTGPVDSDQGMEENPRRGDCVLCWKKRNKERTETSKESIRKALSK